MNKTKNSDLLYRRILMSIAGVTLCGVSVGFFRHASLGVDPFQSLMSGLNAVVPIRFGTLYLLANLLLLSFSLILDRRKIGLATIINLTLLGYVTEFSQAAVSRFFPAPSLSLRFSLFAFAIVLICLSSSLYFTADLGVSTYDAVSLIWSEKQRRIPFALCRVITDLFCVVCGLVLCLLGGYTLGQLTGVVGIGTIVTAFFMGPLIELFSRKLSRPLLYGRNS